MNIKIIVATHKQYEMPKDEMYFPLHVGAYGKEKIFFTGDNTGDNISKLNSHSKSKFIVQISTKIIY